MHIESLSAAFLAGLGTGAHCSLMCGPLACALKARPLEYHAGRLVSYTMGGVLCGGLGEWVLRLLKTGPVGMAPWALLAVFVAMALGLERRFPLPAFASAWGTRIKLDRNLGWLTPLIPCGPLWFLFGAAATTGSAVTGGLLLLSFGLGTAFLYGALQSGVIRLQRSHPRWNVRFLQTGFLWCAILVLAWRIWNGGEHGCCSL